jgi:hypothetical protein
LTSLATTTKRSEVMLNSPTIPANEQFLSDDVLYYPTISFLDDRWLRQALCLWDCVYRIVPEGHQPADSQDTIAAIEAGLVRSITCTKQELSATAVRFEDFVDSLNGLPAGLDGTTVQLHLDKVDAHIVPLLNQLMSTVDDEGFLEIPYHIAHGYMLFLAEEMSRQRRLAKVTDNPHIFSVIPFMERDGEFDEWVYNTDAERFYGAVMLPVLFPSGLASERIENVIKFHETHASGRRRFRESLRSICATLSNPGQTGRISDELVRHRERLNVANLNMLDALKTNLVDARRALLTTGLPVAATIYSAIAGRFDRYDAIPVGAGILLGVVTAMATAKPTAEPWSQTERSYYLDVQSAFPNGDLARMRVPNFYRDFEEFMND